MNLDAGGQQAVLRILRRALPRETDLLVLGNTAALGHRVPHVTRTKDVDVSLVVVDPNRHIAPTAAIHGVLTNLGINPETAPADGSWVKAFVELDGTSYQVDFIRGKSRDRPNGTFIDRPTLNAIVQAATRHRDAWLPSLSDLILMKAWAATDQSRYLRQDPADPTGHEERRRAYRHDARRLTEHALDHDELDRGRLRNLVGRMARHRRTDISGELVRAGTLEPDGPDA